MSSLVVPSERIGTLLEQIRMNELGRGESRGRIWRELQALSGELFHPLIIVLGRTGIRIEVRPNGSGHFHAFSGLDALIFLFGMSDDPGKHLALSPSEMEDILSPDWGKELPEESPERRFLHAAESIFQGLGRRDLLSQAEEIKEVFPYVEESFRLRVIMRGVLVALQRGEKAVTIELGDCLL